MTLILRKSEKDYIKTYEMSKYEKKNNLKIITNIIEFHQTDIYHKKVIILKIRYLVSICQKRK